jgi:hypothetical protein
MHSKPTSHTRVVSEPSSEIVLRGRVTRRTRDELAAMLRGVVELSPRRVLHVRGTLVRGEDPALPLPVVAAARLELASHIVQAHAAAATEREAIDLLEARLRRNVRKLAGRALAERHQRVPPNAGRCGNTAGTSRPSTD